MADGGDSYCYQSFGSGYYKSALHLLFGEKRKRIFLDAHPLNSIKAKNIGLKWENAFYNVDSQEIEYKDKDWRVKANLGAGQFINLKMKIGEKAKGTTRNHIFVGAWKDKLSLGGMFSFKLGTLLTGTSRMKFYSDKTAQIYTDATVSGVKLGSDLELDAATGVRSGFLGASLGLPDLALARNVHAGAVLSYPELRPSLGLFCDVSVPRLQRATFGLEVFRPALRPTVKYDAGKFPDKSCSIIGCELVVNDKVTIVGKMGDNFVAQLSLVQKYKKGLKLRIGVEADLTYDHQEPGIGKLGATVTMS